MGVLFALRLPPSAMGHIPLACWPVLHTLHPGSLCSISGCQASAAGYSLDGFLITLGACLEATELGTLVFASRSQVHTGPVVLLPLHPALFRLEPCLELNRAPTLSFLGHVPIGCPRGNRVTEGIC